MSTSGCCDGGACGAAERKERTSARDPLFRRTAKRGVKASGWALPGIILVLMPKCPMCVAAYIGIATGIGISVSAATHLRWVIMAACAVTLGFVAAELMARLIRISSHKQLQ